MTSIQILNSDVQLTAADFAVINVKLMFTIIGTITTYLVILIQFSSNDKTVCFFVTSINATNKTN